MFFLGFFFWFLWWWGGGDGERGRGVHIKKKDHKLYADDAIKLSLGNFVHSTNNKERNFGGKCLVQLCQISQAIQVHVMPELSIH